MRTVCDNVDEMVPKISKLDLSIVNILKIPMLKVVVYEGAVCTM